MSEEKNIFTYWNGKRDVKCDPWPVEIRFRRACARKETDEAFAKFRGPDWMPLVDCIDPATGAEITPDEANRRLEEEGVDANLIAFTRRRRDEGVEELIPVFCETFGVKTLEQDEEDGMSYADIINAFNAWQAFISGVKKNTSSSVNASPGGGEASPSAAGTSGKSPTSTSPTSTPGTRRSRSPARSNTP